jgi:hypothetical protein
VSDAVGVGSAMHANKRPRQDDRKTKKQPLSCAECRRRVPPRPPVPAHPAQAQAQGPLPARPMRVLTPSSAIACSPANPARSAGVQRYVQTVRAPPRTTPCSPPHRRTHIRQGQQVSPPPPAATRSSPARFILANTEQLHAKIIQMSDRIRQLEDALGALQATCATDPHPLLTQDLLRIKNSLELYSPQPAPSRPHLPDDPTPSSSLLPSPDADRRPSEVSLRPVSSASSAPPQDSSVEIAPTDIPRLSPEIEKLSQTFPYPWLTNNPMRERIYSMLPSRQEAEYLCTQARLNALWQ